MVRERCIGCGLCVTTCATEAVTLFHKGAEERVLPPVNEAAWFDQRGETRGVDFAAYR